MLDQFGNGNDQFSEQGEQVSWGNQPSRPPLSKQSHMAITHGERHAGWGGQREKPLGGAFWSDCDPSWSEPTKCEGILPAPMSDGGIFWDAVD